MRLSSDLASTFEAMWAVGRGFEQWAWGDPSQTEPGGLEEGAVARENR